MCVDVLCALFMCVKSAPIEESMETVWLCQQQKHKHTQEKKKNNTVKESYSALSHAQVNELFTKWTHIYTHVCMLLSSDCRCFLFPNAPNVYIKCWLHFAKHHLCASLGLFFGCLNSEHETKTISNWQRQTEQSTSQMHRLGWSHLCTVQFDECNVTDVINGNSSVFGSIDWLTQPLASSLNFIFSTCAQFYVSQFGLDATMMIVGKTCVH